MDKNLIKTRFGPGDQGGTRDGSRLNGDGV